MSFNGFPRETLYTPTPDPVFGQLLEEIQDLTELKITLRGMWMLHHKRQGLRAIPLGEFLSDTVLLRGIDGGDEPGGPVEAIRRGLRQAVRRGTFIVHGNTPEKAVFVLNNDSGRRTLERMKASDAGVEVSEEGDEAPASVRERPNIFALYEDTIGMLTPLVVERLKEAELRYPPGWIREAFEIAALENKRSWNYVSAILARWGSEGKGNWAGGSHDNGKPGRGPAQNGRKKYGQDYERRRGRPAPRTGAR